jgi:hypothetical protein
MPPSTKNQMEHLDRENESMVTSLWQEQRAAIGSDMADMTSMNHSTASNLLAR